MGLEGFTVFVDLDEDGIFDLEEQGAVTSRTGGYFIPNLEPGTFLVREVQRPGFVPTTPLTQTITLEPGEILDNIDFGNRPEFTIIEGRILGQAFFDIDGDSIQDPNEPGIEDIRVYLDLNLSYEGFQWNG